MTLSNKIKNFSYTNGFSLFGFLVIIIIICILVGVVIPQYHLFVDKKKVQKILIDIEGIHKEEEAYKAKNGKYTLNFSELNLKFPNRNARIVNKSMLFLKEEGLQYVLVNDYGVPGVEVYEKITERKYGGLLFISPKKKICMYDSYDKRGTKLCMSLGCPKQKHRSEYWHSEQCYF